LILGKYVLVLFDNLFPGVIASLNVRCALPQQFIETDTMETTMTAKAFGKTILIAALLATGSAQAQ
jgi:hypothetical protein